MATLTDLFFEPGWSTSAPGDMKNPLGTGLRQFGASQHGQATTRVVPTLAKPELTPAMINAGIKTGAEMMDRAIRAMYNKGIHEAIADIATTRSEDEQECTANPDVPQTEVDAW